MKDELDDSREKKGNGSVGTSSEVCASMSECRQMMTTSVYTL